ncbi:hypothetical protein BTURTLESOX_1104 [bacterium endosymbiont of Bathymodiolus sp. 5 South]|nr:hypothetical protein BTURTLESOX_1104 [bacterium endosymbiont of Bathymodiolus sp. 5 South]
MRLLAVKFEAMLVVVALVVALTLLENKLLGLDFICTDLESCTDEIFKTPLVATSTKVCRDFAVLTSWLTAYALPTPLNTKAFKWLSIKSREKGFLRVGIGVILDWFF